MKLVIGSSQSQDFSQDNQAVYTSADYPNFTQILQVFDQNVFDLIECTDILGAGANLLDKELWRLLFRALKQNGDLNLLVNLEISQSLNGYIGSTVHDSVSSLLKLNGFSNIHVTGSLIQAKKPIWQAAGAPLKRREKQADQVQQQVLTTTQQQASNPWAALQQKDGGVVLINEDELMKDDTQAVNSQVFQQFCGDDDMIKAGKPCENCTCGRKEVEEGKITQKDLEVGNVESNCGKCYLGDAFRCASCPYLGQPAFEAGDKVKLKNSTNAQMSVDRDFIPVKAAVGTKVVLEL